MRENVRARTRMHMHACANSLFPLWQPVLFLQPIMSFEGTAGLSKKGKTSVSQMQLHLGSSGYNPFLCVDLNIKSISVFLQHSAMRSALYYVMCFVYNTVFVFMCFKQLNLSPPEENNIMVNVSYMLNLLHVKWLKVCWPLVFITFLQVFPLAFLLSCFAYSDIWNEGLDKIMSCFFYDGLKL